MRREQHVSSDRSYCSSPSASRKPSASKNPHERHWREYIIDEELGDFPVGWEKRTTTSGAVYFVDHIHRTTTFEDPRVADREERRRQAIRHEASLPQYKRDLRRKVLRLHDLFRHKLKNVTKAVAATRGKDDTFMLKVDVPISRENVFEDSFMVIMKLRPDQLEGKLNIQFFGEDALDYGGVSREWFFSLSKEMMNPYYGLFQPAPSDQYMLQINPLSTVNPNHLSYFQFVGRVIGLAIKHGQHVEGGFIMPLYKVLLGKDVNLEDMAQVDPEYHSSLVWILHNDITDVIENSFCDEQDVFGEVVQVDLKPNGRNIPVTEGNKHAYVELIVKHRLLGGIKQQVAALQKGFNEVVPLSFMDMYDEMELELIICGLGQINISDWVSNTEYRHCDKSDNVVSWFWQAVESMESELRARLLQFATGTSRVPVTGFRDLQGSLGPKKFTIELVEKMDKGALPQAHTCFNRIDFPRYESFEVLNAKLVLAVENTQGFGLE